MFGIEFLGLKLAAAALTGLAGWGIYKNWSSIWPKVNSVDDLKNLWYSVNSPEDILKHLEDAKARVLEMITEKKNVVDETIHQAQKASEAVEAAKADLAKAEEVAAKLG